MKIIKFIGSILKDIFINIYYLIKGLLGMALLLGIASAILILMLIAISIVPRILILFNLNNLASVFAIAEITIIALFMIDINVFKIPTDTINYLKRKWKEIC